MESNGNSLREIAINARPLENLIDQARSGSQPAFAEIVRRFRPSLLHRASSILGDGHLAEDAVQETLLEAHKRLGDLKHNAAFAAWTARILVKYCDRITRKQTEIPRSPEKLNKIEDARIQERRLDKPELLEVIATLSGLDHSIAQAFFVQGRPQKEIADELKIPLHTVKNRLKRARNDFKKMRNLFATELRAA
ncbi:MAG: sigma-70 family RNA polymerase sigma factor [Spirochaetia bacterium]|nr:sigma-70 family RNA polymerase sigma factor [Spirochaetia bacterium]